MTNSMTAFTRHSIQKEWGTVTIELRSLNHRFLELEFRLPDIFRDLEAAMRTQALEYLHRGKVECHFKYKPAESLLHQFSINQHLLRQLAEISANINRQWEGRISTSLMEILNCPGILLPMQEPNKAVITDDVLLLFKEALADLVAMRGREGAALEQRIEQRLEQVLVEANKIKERLPIFIQQQRQKILTRIEELRFSVEPQRLEEEILALMQKMDVSEEIERLEIHVGEVRETLKSTHAVGRRLDFLMQELHRESNTLGSKSTDAQITHCAIHLKVLVEQMREQVQNIE